MIRKPRTELKESSENPEIDANVRLDWMLDALSIERLILDTSPLPMAALEGPDHILRYANSAFCRLVSKTQAELTGRPLATAVSWEGCIALLNLVYSTGEVKIQIEPKEIEAHSARWSYTMWPVLGADDHPVGVLMQVTEITQFHRRAIAVNEQLLLSGVRQHELRETAEKLNAQLQLEIAERKKMERALVTSEKLAVTARFALTMAHEINNPLEAMTNLVYLLAPLQTSPEARAYIATIEDQLQGLSRIATQALKFHRDANKPGVFKLDAVLREVSDFYRPQAERQGVVLHQRFETDGAISTFRSEIVQVITNLLLNALDATPLHGQVIIHLYLDCFPGDRLIQGTRNTVANRLLDVFERTHSPTWDWFEKSLSYSNARLSQALLVAGCESDNKRMVEAGCDSLRWLVAEQRRGDVFMPIGSKGFFTEGGEKASFDQQPVEACGTISACLQAYRITNENQWLEEAWRAFRWFFGKNDLEVPLYDATTGGCRDGLHPDRVNENQGAESTLSFLMALLEMQGMEMPTAKEQHQEMSVCL